VPDSVGGCAQLTKNGKNSIAWGGGPAVGEGFSFGLMATAATFYGNEKLTIGPWHLRWFP
jgi:hypothetical protein